MYRFKPVIEAVDALGARDNTYIVFSTDNGAQGERWTSNRGGSGPNGDTSGAFTNAVGTQGPFRGCKASLYDGGHPSSRLGPPGTVPGAKEIRFTTVNPYGKYFLAPDNTHPWGPESRAQVATACRLSSLGRGCQRAGWTTR
jgi:hypothetical protein